MTQDQATKPGKTPIVAPTEADATGLTEAEAARRLAQYGENALVEHHVSVLERLAHFFWGPIPWMIEIAAVLSAYLSIGRISPSSWRCSSSMPASASGRSSRPTTPSPS